jgi:predicted SAM-dependent methyltransferase
LTIDVGWLNVSGKREESNPQTRSKSVDSFKSFVKSHTTYALRRALRDIVQEGRLSYRHWSAVRKAPRYLQSPPLKLNLGCGPNGRPGWLNIDLFDSAAELQLDLRKRWPFPDDSVDHVYSEHAFEHFEFTQEVPHFLAESLRVLRSGGIFEWPLRGYGNPDHDYWPFAPTWHPQSCETQLDHLNYHFRQDEQHKYAWDEETLARSLRRSGFVSIVRRDFDANLDTKSRKIGTLYMRAIKPGQVS